MCWVWAVGFRVNLNPETLCAQRRPDMCGGFWVEGVGFRVNLNPETRCVQRTPDICVGFRV
jgi:hypothetical protein